MSPEELIFHISQTALKDLDFPTETEAYQFLERICWTDGPVCPHCDTSNRAYLLTPRKSYHTTSTGKAYYRRLWKCAVCRREFSVMIEPGWEMFRDCKSPTKLIRLIALLCQTKGRISTLELARQVGFTYKTAYRQRYRLECLICFYGYSD